MVLDWIFKPKPDVKNEIITQAALVRKLQRDFFAARKADNTPYPSKSSKQLLQESKKQEVILDQMLMKYEKKECDEN